MVGVRQQPQVCAGRHLAGAGELVAVERLGGLISFAVEFSDARCCEGPIGVEKLPSITAASPRHFVDKCLQRATQIVYQLRVKTWKTFSVFDQLLRLTNVEPLTQHVSGFSPQPQIAGVLSSIRADLLGRVESLLGDGC